MRVLDLLILKVIFHNYEITLKTLVYEKSTFKLSYLKVFLDILIQEFDSKNSQESQNIGFKAFIQIF